MKHDRIGRHSTSRRGALAAALIALVSAASPLPARAAETAPRPEEPAGFRMDEYRAPTPATLKGATVLDADAAHALWTAGKAVFVDVLPRTPKPTNLPEGTVWRDKQRSNIPNGVWLPNTGYGAIAPEIDAYFRKGLETATGGDKARTLVFYCLRDCWQSWNAAKRALGYGYTAVAWYPDGTDGWADHGWPLAPAEPAP